MGKKLKFYAMKAKINFYNIFIYNTFLLRRRWKIITMTRCDKNGAKLHRQRWKSTKKHGKIVKKPKMH